MLTSDPRSKTSLAMKQSFLDKSIHQNISKFIESQTEVSHKSQLLRVQDDVMVKDSKTNDKVTPQYRQPKSHRFTGKNAMLFFNVTVLSDGGRNKSSALYLVPFAGSKAIMISWGTYNDSSWHILVRLYWKSWKCITETTRQCTIPIGLVFYWSGLASEPMWLSNDL